MAPTLSSRSGTVIGPLAAAVNLALIIVCPAAPAQSGPVSAAAASPEAGAAFVDIAVVPMDVERVLQHQIVVICGGRIIAMGSVDRTAAPNGMLQIDGRGRYLLPSLGDCHTHMSATLARAPWLPWPADLSAEVIAERRLLRWLADGVTVIRNVDFGEKDRREGKRDNPWLLTGPELLRLRARAAAGTIVSPRIYTAGQWAPIRYTKSGAGGEFSAVPPLDSVAGYVAKYKAAGYDVLKVHDESSEVFGAVLAAAREVGLPVVGHLKGPLEVALAGKMQSIEHLGGLGEQYGYPQAPEKKRRDTSAAAVAAYRTAVTAYRTEIAKLAAETRRAGTWNCIAYGDGPDMVRALQDSGAGVLLGTDASDPWDAVQSALNVANELERLVQSQRLTPYEALASGTTNFARYLKQLDPTFDGSGTVAIGGRADLMMLTGDPLENIANVKSPVGVMLQGRWFTRADLDRLSDSLAQEEHYLKQVAERTNLVNDILGDTSLAVNHTRSLRVLDSLSAQHQKRALALLDSLRGNPDSATGSRRLIALLAKQLEEVRAVLPVVVRASFDTAVQAWQARREQEGYNPVP